MIYYRKESLLLLGKNCYAIMIMKINKGEIKNAREKRIKY